MKLLIWVRSFVVTLFLFPIWTILGCFVAVFAEKVLRSRALVNRMIKIWGRSSCWMYGVKINVHGEENFPVGGAMVLFNHTSFFDIISLYACFPFVRFGAKLELFSIPIFGWTMEALGTLPIARANREEAIRVLQNAIARAKNGEKFALSPEGGRSEDEDELMPFKAGPFVFAIQAQIPLVPLIIRGAMPVWPKGVWIPATDSWTSEITLDVLPPISTLGTTIDDRDHLQTIARERMEIVIHGKESTEYSG